LNQYSTAPERQLQAEMLEALPRLRRFARSLTGNPADADDLMQATAERVLERGVPADVNVLKWMFTVCKNLYIDQLRAQAVRSRATENPELAEEPSISGEDVAIGELTLREVDQAMAKLSDEQRAVITLIAVEGLSYKETAKVLDIPIGTVMSRLARARSTLANTIGNAAHAENGND
jgi:RNA polymerase sigma-70 factor (ECF subfamily)